MRCAYFSLRRQRGYLYLSTGANGTGKTLFTLADVRALQLATNRPVFYKGFTAKQPLVDFGPAAVRDRGAEEAGKERHVPERQQQERGGRVDVPGAARHVHGGRDERDREAERDDQRAVRHAQCADPPVEPRAADRHERRLRHEQAHPSEEHCAVQMEEPRTVGVAAQQRPDVDRPEARDDHHRHGDGEGHVDARHGRGRS